MRFSGAERRITSGAQLHLLPGAAAFLKETPLLRAWGEELQSREARAAYCFPAPPKAAPA